MGKNTGFCPKIVSSSKWGLQRKGNRSHISSNKDSSGPREVKHSSLLHEVAKENATKQD